MSDDLYRDQFNIVHFGGTGLCPRSMWQSIGTVQFEDLELRTIEGEAAEEAERLATSFGERLVPPPEQRPLTPQKDLSKWPRRR